MASREESDGGSRIVRHSASAEHPAGLADQDGHAMEAIAAHLRQFIGEPAQVFHEIVSDRVHIDVHIVAPRADRDFYTLITTGMSDLPMTAPPGAEGLRFAELVLALPATWTSRPLWDEDLEDEALYWPIRLLKTLTRLPHEYATWLGYGHTIPNGDPPEPYSSGTDLCCALLLPPLTVPPEFFRLDVRTGKTIHFYGVVPLYRSETEFKLRHGTDGLVDCLLDWSVTELVDAKRPPTVDGAGRPISPSVT
jgi:hypothetical protein